MDNTNIRQTVVDSVRAILTTVPFDRDNKEFMAIHMAANAIYNILTGSHVAAQNDLCRAIHFNHCIKQDKRNLTY